MNREAWLAKLVDLLRPKFIALQAPLPKEVRVSVGFPSSRALSTKSRRVGECWMTDASTDGVHQIFITPLESDAVEVGAILVHELAHAALPAGTSHKKPFANLAVKLGLEGKPTHTTAGADLVADLKGLLDELGPYPHAGLSAALMARKKQTTRLKKVECTECHYVARVTAKWLEKGAPICPTDNIVMGIEEEEDGGE